MFVIVSGAAEIWQCKSCKNYAATVGTTEAPMENRVRVVPRGAATSPESAMASELFDQFVSAATFKSVLATYRQLCELLRLKPTNITNFYPRLKAKLHSWRAASLWAKLDKRASHKCYNRGKACPNTRVSFFFKLFIKL